MELFLSWVPAIVLLLVGVVLVRRDPRRLLPGILFGALLFLLLSRVLSLLLGGVGRAIGGELGEAWALLGFILLGAFAVVLLGVGLLWNTFEMVRRERPGPAALVTGAIGLVLLAYVAGGVLALVFDSTVIFFDLLLLMPPLAYVGFVFVCFLLYSTVYGWAMRRFGGPVDAVVVLGSGLLGGERISPCWPAGWMWASGSTNVPAPRAARPCSSPPAGGGATRSSPSPRRWPATSWSRGSPDRTSCSRTSPPIPARTWNSLVR